MAKRYIIQKREISERHGKRPQLMGPYRTLYSDIHPPFDLGDREKIEANLLRQYGEGRYQVKSVGKDEGEKKSTIKVHFSGDVERYKPRSKTWTKDERVAYVHAFKSTNKEKRFVYAAFLVIGIISMWLFMFTMEQGMDPIITVMVIVLIIIVLAAAIVFIDMMHYGTE